MCKRRQVNYWPSIAPLPASFSLDSTPIQELCWRLQCIFQFTSNATQGGWVMVNGLSVTTEQETKFWWHNLMKFSNSNVLTREANPGQKESENPHREIKLVHEKKTEVQELWKCCQTRGGSKKRAIANLCTACLQWQDQNSHAAKGRYILAGSTRKVIRQEDHPASEQPSRNQTLTSMLDQTQYQKWGQNSPKFDFSYDLVVRAKSASHRPKFSTPKGPMTAMCTKDRPVEAGLDSWQLSTRKLFQNVNIFLSLHQQHAQHQLYFQMPYSGEKEKKRVENALRWQWATWLDLGQHIHDEDWCKSMHSTENIGVNNVSAPYFRKEKV